MHPYFFDIPFPLMGRLRLPSYGLMIACGYLVCLYLLQRRGRRMGLDPIALFDMATFALIGGLLGARLFYVVHHWEAFEDGLLKVFAFWRGGLTFYGGLLGGGLGVLFIVRRKGLPLTTTLDVTASLMPLGHAFGRTGCFLEGCCYGKQTAAAVGVRFPKFVDAAGRIEGSPAFLEHLQAGQVSLGDAWSLPVHPTQLYEVAYNMTAFVLLAFLLRRRPGDVAWTYAIFYGCARFANEYVRGDTVPLPGLGGLTVFQALSILIAGFGVVMLAAGLPRERVPLPEPWQPPADEAGESG